MDWQQTTLMPAIGAAFLGLVRTPPEKRDQTAIAASVARTEAQMAILAKELAGRAYIAGDAFTMGDIPIGAVVHRWCNMPVQRAEHPALRTYYERVFARPSARKALFLPVT